MSNWICDKCGANYIDVSHQEPSVLREELELRKVKQQLAIAVEALFHYSSDNKDYLSNEDKETADQALQKIEELKK